MRKRVLESWNVERKVREVWIYVNTEHVYSMSRSLLCLLYTVTAIYSEMTSSRRRSSQLGRGGSVW
jgi:hypothetical protein